MAGAKDAKSDAKGAKGAKRRKDEQGVIDDKVRRWRVPHVIIRMCFCKSKYFHSLLN